MTIGKAMAVERSDGKVYVSLREAARQIRLERGLPRRGLWENSGLANTAFRIREACNSGKRVLGYQWQLRPNLDERTGDDDGQPDETQEWHDYDPDC